MGKIGFKNPPKIQLKYEFLLSRVGGGPPLLEIVVIKEVLRIIRVIKDSARD